MTPARPSIILRQLMAFLALMTAPAWLGAADKSGVGPNTISVPKGPGSIEGMGEAFQPTLNTGTAKHGISFALPPGTAGHGIKAGLAYEGGSGNGPVGFGWRMTVPFVQRQTEKGIPRYVDADNAADDDHDGTVDEADERDRFINESKEELVALASGDHFAENEGAFTRYRRVGAGWEGTDASGTVMRFGSSAVTQITDGVGQVFCWLLDSSTDTRGNTIRLTYAGAPGAENLNQKYLQRIEYGPGTGPWTAFHFVQFTYEARNDWFEDCRAGFPIRTGQRLKTVSVCTQGVNLAGHQSGDRNGDGLPDYLNRRYELGYFPYAGASTHWSYLETVQILGADGASSLPPARYGYSVCNPPEVLSAAGKIIGVQNAPLAVMDNPLVDLVELNGDGLPDILKTTAGGGAHSVAYNLGEKETPAGKVIAWSSPAEVASSDGQAWGINLQSGAAPGEAIAHLADMDADGTADLVYHTEANSVFFFKNRYRIGWGDRLPMASEGAPPPSPFGDANTKTADVDFDKRMDIIQSQPVGGGADYRVWYNIGSQSYSEPLTYAQTDGMLLSQTGVSLADWNGDRMSDMVRIRPATLEITAAWGHGKFSPLRTITIPGGPLTTEQIGKASMKDITGDGLADLVVEKAEPGVLWYWINLGTDQLAQRRSITGLPAGDANAAVRWADLNGNTTTDYVLASALNDPVIQVVDLGTLMGCVSASSLMNRIENGTGRVTTIEYSTSSQFAAVDAAAGNPWEGPVPFPVSVVARVLTSDRNGHQYESRFVYHDGYYDGIEQEFRGFGRVEVIETGDATAPTLVSRSWFDTGRTHKAMKGKLLRLTSEDQTGLAFSDETTAWELPPRVLHTGTDGRQVRYAVPDAKEKRIKERGVGTERTLQSEMDFDNYGNQTALRDFGIVVGNDRSAFDDERFTSTQYAINTTAWILRAVAQTEVGDENGNLISRSRQFYDDETFSGGNFLQVLRGEVTLSQDWVNPAAGPVLNSARTKYDAYGNPVVLLGPKATDETGGHVRRIEWDPVFHSYPITETIQLGGGKAPLIYRAEYDQGFGSLTAATDFNGHRTAFGYDAFARLISIVKPGDTAALPTAEYSYHLAVPHGGGIINFVETRTLDREAAAPGTKRDHYSISREFVDGLGRKLLTKTEAEPATTGGAPRVAVSGAVLFNARTTPSAALNPFFSTLGGSLDDQLAFENIEAPGWTGVFSENGNLVTLPLATAHKSSTLYDAAGREVEAINPGGTRRRTEFEPLIVRSFDENDNDPASSHFGTPMVHHKDGLGRLIQADEITRLNDDGTPAGALKTWSTRYSYDLNDQLLTITDSKANVKRQTFDGLKRMTWMNDPNRGVMDFHYDAASNLTETTDAKGQRILFTYDGANRIETEDYLDEGLPFSKNRAYNPAQPITAANRPDIAYFYDAAVPGLSMGDSTTATAGNVLGRLSTVWDLSGEEHTSYDARGRVDWTVKRIADPGHGGLVAFRTGFGYDAADRLRLIQYPDNDFVPYEYNERSLLSRIPGGPSGNIIAGVDYLPSGQMAGIRYGNATSSSYAYDPRLRLNKLTTVSAALSAQLLHYSYDFDAVSNLRSIADERPVSAIPAGDSRRNTQIFGYDDLYRIIRVQYSFAAPGSAPADNGSIDYRYDRIGNLLAQTSTLSHAEKGLPVANLGTLSYGGTAGSSHRDGRASGAPAGPHALTSIAGPAARAFPYDDNGNMTSLDGMTATWDFKDRLVAVEDGQMRAEYGYDFTDQRITKKVIRKTAPGHATSVLYVGKHFEVREGEAPTKFIWNGETRVARVTGSLSTTARLQRLKIHAGWNLAALAIDSTQTLTKLSASAPSLLLEAHALDPVSGTFAPIAGTASFPAGSVLWIKSSSSATLHLLGTMPNAPPSLGQISAQGRFFGTGFTPLPLASQPAGLSLWRFSPDFQRWQTRLASPLEALSDAPPILPTGEGLFAQSSTPLDVQIPDSALSIRYYHQDHLGSSSVMTDAAGQLVEESSYYPFGHPRQEHRPKGIREDYQFTQKERDAESGLNYFEARFLAASLGRFIRVDPLAAAMPQKWMGAPQKLNLYAYCSNRPVTCTDPTGTDSVDGLLTAQADRAGQWLGANGGIAGAALGAGIYATVSLLDPTANAANAGEQLGVALDSSKSGLERMAGAAGVVGYSAAAALDMVGLKAVTGLFSKGEKALAGAVDNVLSSVDNGVESALSTGSKADFVVTPEGVAIPLDSDRLKSGLTNLTDTSTNPASSRKFVGSDANGPIRIRIEKSHGEDVAFSGTPDPLHTVDHMHIDRRSNGDTGAWTSKDKIQYDWPFDD